MQAPALPGRMGTATDSEVLSRSNDLMKCSQKVEALKATSGAFCEFGTDNSHVAHRPRLAVR